MSLHRQVNQMMIKKYQYQSPLPWEFLFEPEDLSQVQTIMTLLQEKGWRFTFTSQPKKIQLSILGPKRKKVL